MRTTLELPDDLLKRAKIEAVERGVSLKDLIGSALAKELGSAEPPASRRRRLTFPLVASKAPGSLKLTNADIALAETDEDFRRHVLSR